MLDGVSLDQLRTFIAAADEGSFSAGGRRLRRAQSVVSQTLANLEAQLGVKLFDRSRRSPVLTKQGVALLAEARAVVGGMDVFKARAKGLSGGLEPELSVVVDVVFPLERLTAAVAAFQEKFPAVPFRLNVEALGAVLQPVIEGRCAFGVMGSLPTAPAQLTREHLLNVGWAFVVSPKHPLASLKGSIPARVLAQHRQLVLTDRSELSPKSFPCDSSERSVRTSCRCCASTRAGIDPLSDARGCVGDTTKAHPTLSRCSRVSCAGAVGREPITPKAQRPSITGCKTAPSASTFSLNGTAGNF